MDRVGNPASGQFVADAAQHGVDPLAQESPTVIRQPVAGQFFDPQQADLGMAAERHPAPNVIQRPGPMAAPPDRDQQALDFGSIDAAAPRCRKKLRLQESQH